MKFSVKHKKITFVWNPCILNKTKSMPSTSQGENCNCKVIFEWDYPNKRPLKPYWPQTASELLVEFQGENHHNFQFKFLLC